jgi:hypothetical protein
MALKYLLTTQPAPVVINDVARRYIQVGELSPDGREHLAQLTGIELED